MRAGWGVGGLVALLLATALFTEATAAEPKACAYAADIRILAPLLLPGPQQLPGEIPSNETADAAYLMLRYGGLAKTESDALLDALPTQLPTSASIDALRLVTASAKERLAAIEADTSPEHSHSRLATLARSSVMRLAFLDGHAEQLFQRLAQLIHTEHQREDFYKMVLVEEILIAGADLQDPVKLQVAAAALDAGFYEAGLKTLASMDDLTEWLTMARRLAAHFGEGTEKERVLAAYRKSRGFEYRRNGFDGLPNLLDDIKHDNNAIIDKTEDDFDKISRNSMYIRRFFLHTYESTAILKAEPDVLSSVRERRIVITDQDALDLEIVRSMDRAMGRVTRIAFIAQVPRPIARDGVPDPTYPIKVDGELYLGIARLALRDYVAGRAPDLPAAPPRELPSNFPWNQWVEAAKSVQSGNITDHKLSAHLLASAGRTSEAASELKLLSGQDRAAAYYIAWQMLGDLSFACGGDANIHSRWFNLHRFD